MEKEKRERKSEAPNDGESLQVVGLGENLKLKHVVMYVPSMVWEMGKSERGKQGGRKSGTTHLDGWEMVRRYR